MAEIIHSITITKARFNGKKLLLEWMLNEGKTWIYSGTYTLTVTEDGQKFYESEKPFSTVEASVYETELPPVTEGKSYKATLCTDMAIEASVFLIVDTFKEVKGSYNGEEFSFSWSMESTFALSEVNC